MDTKENRFLCEDAVHKAFARARELWGDCGETPKILWRNNGRYCWSGLD